MKRGTVTPKTAQARLLGLHSEFRSWAKVAQHLSKDGHKFDRGQLCQIARGKPAPNSVLRALGLPLRAVEVEPCARCGGVHVTKRCTADKMAPEIRIEVEKFIVWARERELARR